MAEYDGAIRIVTKITTKDATESLSSLEYQIKKSAKYIDELRKKMDALKDQKIPTKEYKDLQDELSKAETALSGLIAKQEEWTKLGISSGLAWDELNEKVAAAGDEVDSIKAKIHALADAGKDFTIGKDTAEYKSYAQQIRYEEEAIAKAGEHYKELLSNVPERFAQMRAAAQKAFDAIRAGFSTIGKVGKKAFSGIVGMAKKLFSSITSGSKQSNASFSGGLKTILRYGFGIRSVYALFNKIRSGITEGFKNLMGYSDNFANSIQSVKNSMSTLGNQIAAAFAPIVQMVIPWLNALISALSTAMTYVAQFMAALTGSSTFTRAKKVQDAYNKSLGGTAKAADKARGALAKFDDLDVLQKQDDTGGGGAGGAGAGAGMFEEVPIDDKWKKIVDWLKEMWENSDFYELGKLLGEKLKEALDGIDWEPVKEIARKIGKSLATLINGFIEVKELGISIGKTLAEAVNTGFEFLNSFVHKFHFDSLGGFIADGLNGLFESINWSLIKNTFVTGFRGLAGSINSFISNFRWDNLSESISNLVNSLTESISAFFATVKWDELGANIGEQLTRSIKKINWKQFGKALGDIIQSALSFLKNFIKKMNLKDIAQAAIDSLKGAFGTIDMGDLASVFLTVLAARLTVSAAGFAFNTAAGTIMQSLSNALASTGFVSLASTILGGLETAISAAAPYAAIGVAAVAGLSAAFSDMNKEIEEQTQLEVFGDKLDNITGKIHDQTEAIKNRSDASMEYVEKAGMAEMNMASDLSDRYFDLAEKENLTNAEKEEMRRLAQNLVNTLPGLEEYYNTETGLLDATRQSIDNLIASRLQEIKLAAIEDKLKEGYENQADALDNLKSAIEPANQAQEHMNQLNEEYQSLLDKISQLEAYNSLSEQISSCSGNTEELLARQADLWNEITNGGTESFPTFDSLMQRMGEVNQELYDFQDEYNEALGTLSDASDAYSAVETNISDLTEMLTNGMTQAADYAASGYADKMSSDTSMADSTLNQAHNLLEGFNRELDINSPSGKFKEAAGYAIEGWNIGIEENKQSVMSGIIALATEIADAFRQTFIEQFGLFGSSVRETLGLLNSDMETVFTEMLEMIFGKWTELLDQSTLTWTQLSDLIKNTLTLINTNILTSLTTVNKNWAEKWTQLVQKAKQSSQEVTGSVSTMQRNIQSACNAMIASINALIASMEKLKSAASSLGSVGGGFGGSAIGGGIGRMAAPAMASYSTQSIQAFTENLPHLASGAVIRGGNPFMAVLGDQRVGQTNVETPAGLIEDLVTRGIEKAGIGSRENIPVNINVIYDGETTARVMIPDILAELKRQGFNVDVLGVT